MSKQFDDARVLVVTREDHEELRGDAAKAGLDLDRLVLTRANHEDMPDLVRLIDIGMFFIRPSFSARACAATKLGEFLASGVPVVTNDGIGDYANLIADMGTGVVVPDVEPCSLEASLVQVRRLLNDPDVQHRCRATAIRHFDVEKGAAAYSSLYGTLVDVGDPRRSE